MFAFLRNWGKFVNLAKAEKAEEKANSAEAKALEAKARDGRMNALRERATGQKRSGRE
jgi:hypothetical protein